MFELIDCVWVCLWVCYCVSGIFCCLWFACWVFELVAFIELILVIVVRWLRIRVCTISYVVLGLACFGYFRFVFRLVYWLA